MLMNLFVVKIGATEYNIVARRLLEAIEEASRLDAIVRQKLNRSQNEQKNVAAKTSLNELFKEARSAITSATYQCHINSVCTEPDENEQPGKEG